MANSVITRLGATGYAGEFSYNGATGTFSADENRNLSRIEGTKPNYGTFDAHRYNETDFNYNPHFTDQTKAADLIQTMMGSIEGVQQELNGVD